MYRKIPNSVKRKIVKLYTGGLRNKEIVRKLGVSSGFISTTIKANDIPLHQSIFQSEDARLQAISLYVNDKCTIAETAAKLGLSFKRVHMWLLESSCVRDMGEAFAIAIQKGRKKRYRSVNIPWQSTKTSKWHFADSKWEVVRMMQLDNDPTVVTWTRFVERVPYKDAHGKRRYYAPDLLVEFQNGQKVVEEIKPECRRFNDDTLAKEKAAIKFFTKKGIAYKIITEKNIGLDQINSFKLEGLVRLSDPERIKAKRARISERMKVKRVDGIIKRKKALRRRTKQIVTLYQTEKTIKEVAEILHTTDGKVYLALKRAGVPRREARMREHERQKHSVRMIERHAVRGSHWVGKIPFEQCARLYIEGYSVPELAAFYRKTEQTIYFWLRRLKVPCRERNKSRNFSGAILGLPQLQTLELQ